MDELASIRRGIRYLWSRLTDWSNLGLFASLARTAVAFDVAVTTSTSCCRLFVSWDVAVVGLFVAVVGFGCCCCGCFWFVDDVVAVGLLFAASFDDVDVAVGFVEVVTDGLDIDGVDLDGGGCDVDVGLLADGVLGAAFGCDCCCGFVSVETTTGFVDDCLSDL